MIRRLRIFGCVFLMVLAARAFAQPPATVERPTAEQSVNPGINDSFLDPNLDVNQYLDRFETESREIYTSRFEILDALELKPGEEVADVGTGTGLFVKPLSEAVGDAGWVFALDIAPQFIERVRSICQLANLPNVTPVLCGERDVMLPPGSIDAAIAIDVYHHFEFPGSSLRSIHKALREGGRFVVVDFERIPGQSRDWILGHVRAGKETFRGEIEAAGFEFVEEKNIPGLEENYFLVFRK